MLRSPARISGKHEEAGSNSKGVTTNTQSETQTEPIDKTVLSAEPSPINSASVSGEQENVKCSGEEIVVKTVNNSAEHLGQLPSVASVYTLLIQFSSPRVRADLISGKFGPNVNPGIIHMLDQLRWTILPRWQHGSIIDPGTRCNVAAVHLTQLISRSEDVFVLEGEGQQSLTYRQWLSTLEMLAADPYWLNVQPNERCVHIIEESSKGIDERGGETSSSQPYRIPVIKREVTKKPATKPSHKKIEEIIISSSDSSSENESDREHYVTQLPRRSRRRSHSDSRSVVMPPVFKMGGRTSLREHFCVFERYFDRKYEGDSHDRTQVLSQFLEGDLLRVYEIIGGRKLKYEAMKTALLEHYDKQRLGKKAQCKEELRTISPDAGESYELFGLRVAELAKRAYPHDTKECAIQMRESFLRALPSQTRQKIIDAELACRASGQSKHLSFSSITQLAKDVQATTIQTKTVMWSSTNSDVLPPQVHPQTQVQPQKQQQSSSSQKTRSYYNRNLTCHGCGKLGHGIRECWKAAGLCLICGQKHDFQECPRYDPNRGNPGKSQPALN